MWARGIRRTLSSVAWAVAIGFAGASGQAAGEEASPDFNSQVQPILASRCFTCHGPDEGSRAAGLRLDTAEGATADLGGYRAIEPGDAEASEILVRLTHEDPDMRMPPQDAGDPLSEEEIDTLRRWIDAGAPYATHWAFVPPERQPTLVDDPEDWARDPIDAWILRKSHDVGLEPSSPADRLTLVRRLYLDLTGLPPAPEVADAFAADDSPMAYTRLVDRLLADPAYAERHARSWLDLARYADTNGYEKDRTRSIWPYRDWVLKAIAADMPLDQFTVEQLAGDMLEDPTRSQRIATGFNRNTMLNEEGGIDPLEYRYLAMVDRVATVGTVWMGMTVGCAQCHTHKYDPITHSDYFALMALLDNADEPEIVVPTEEDRQRIAAHQAQVAERERQLADEFPPRVEQGVEVLSGPAHLQAALDQWIETQREQAAPWRVPEPTEMHSTLPRLRWQSDGSVFADGDATKRDEYTLVYQSGVADAPVTALRLEVLPDERLPAGGPGRAYYEGRRGDFFLSELTVTAGGRPITLQSPSHSHGSLSVGAGSTDAANVIDGDASTGWSTSERPGEAHQWVASFAEPIPPGTEVTVKLLFERHFAASLGRFRISVAAAESPPVASTLPADLQRQLRERQEITPEMREVLRRHFLYVAPELAEARGPLEALRRNRPEPTTTLVMRERPEDNPRQTHRHHRGEYLQPREPVDPGIPQFLRPLLSEAYGEDGPQNRLELARWLVSEDNPLAARIMVNRAWRDLFGHGLVRSPGDLGTQSEPPVYPEVLDLLAVDLQDEGWSLMRLRRRLVLSAVYRQSADVDEQHWQRDPENKYWARGARFRMPAEVIRDTMLAASGFMSQRIGGPSVYPPQDPSVVSLAYGAPAWPVAQGADRYRRSLYTFAKRTAPFAAYSVFDGPTGETCLARRERSNTPLQALTLMNDPMYVELAEGAAASVLDASPPDATDDEIATAIFRRVLTRPPTDSELTAIVDFYQQQRDRSSGDRDSARRDSWTWVARALMNLDEAITRQ